MQDNPEINDEETRKCYPACVKFAPTVELPIPVLSLGAGEKGVIRKITEPAVLCNLKA